MRDVLIYCCNHAEFDPIVSSTLIGIWNQCEGVYDDYDRVEWFRKHIGRIYGPAVNAYFKKVSICITHHTHIPMLDCEAYFHSLA
jgi:hypothetical protein